jgi:hypothetical protein
MNGKRSKKLRGLAKKLRKHPLLSGYVTSVAKPNGNKDFSYFFHRPGAFWDL